jgi:hypothetical protein
MPPVGANWRNRRYAACPLSKEKPTSNTSLHHPHPTTTGVSFAAARKAKRAGSRKKELAPAQHPQGGLRTVMQVR